MEIKDGWIIFEPSTAGSDDLGIVRVEHIVSIYDDDDKGVTCIGLVGGQTVEDHSYTAQAWLKVLGLGSRE